MTNGRTPKLCPAEVRAVAQIVAAEAGVSLAEILGDCRTPSVIRVRQIAYLMARRWTGASSCGLAAIFGRDHTSVRRGARSAERLTATDPDCRALYDRVWSLLERLQDGGQTLGCRSAAVSALHRLSAVYEQRALAAANSAKAKRVIRAIGMAPADVPFHCVGALTIRSGFIEQNDRFVAAMRAAHGDLECALA